MHGAYVEALETGEEIPLIIAPLIVPEPFMGYLVFPRFDDFVAAIVDGSTSVAGMS